MPLDCTRVSTVFDFDGVLYNPFEESINPQVTPIIERLVTWGCTIHIVSYRWVFDSGLVRAVLKLLGVPRPLRGRMLLRPPEFEGGEIEWKTLAYSKLARAGVEVGLVSEDNTLALEAAGRTWPQACLYYYPPGSPPQAYGGPAWCRSLYRELVHGVDTL